MLSFMMSELSAENLYFIMSVLKLRETYYQYIEGFPTTKPKDPKKFAQCAKNIYNAFISEESQLMVNLSADVREGIHFPPSSPSCSLFIPYHIYLALTRFQRS
jgi:hypothetical protein